MITNTLGDLKGLQTIFLTKQDPKDRFDMIAQVCVKTKCFGKEIQRENTWENSIKDIEI